MKVLTRPASMVLGQQAADAGQASAAHALSYLHQLLHVCRSCNILQASFASHYKGSHLVHDTDTVVTAIRMNKTHATSTCLATC